MINPLQSPKYQSNDTTSSVVRLPKIPEKSRITDKENMLNPPSSRPGWPKAAQPPIPVAPRPALGNIQQHGRVRIGLPPAPVIHRAPLPALWQQYH